jgi:opacity protein-like surface antigen
MARDGAGYVGIEGGLLFPKRQSGTFTSVFTQGAQTPAAGTAAAAPGTGLVGTLPATFTTVPAAVSGGSRVKFKRGYDVDVIGGYDFGMFRLEGELAYKRSKLKSFSQDTAFGAAVTTALVPTGTTTPTGGTAFAFPTGDPAAFDLGSRVSVLSGMVNALVDFGIGDTASVYGGGGFGRAKVKALGNSDSAWAWQGIAGVSVPIGGNLGLGLKYRYFRTGKVDLGTGATAFTSTRAVAVANVPAAAGGTATGTTNVNFTRTATVVGDFDRRFSSHSLLLSLVYSMGAPAAPAPPDAPPPPPPPATQTCQDGSVIDAMASCPAPPPPPPPPPAQRGERG